MRVVDTSAWIEWLMLTRTGRAIGDAFPPRENQIVPTIVQLELAHWLARETTESKMAAVLADTERCVVAPLDTKIAMRAAEFRREHKLPTADAVVYATAIVLGADLLTCDAHFKDLPDVVYVPKTRS